ncbi:MAG: hypothetical protein ACLR17_22020 [Enterobacteriaceae bacterium]
MAAAVLSCSALEQRGIEAVWLAILLKTTLTDSGDLKNCASARRWVATAGETEALHLRFEPTLRRYAATLQAVKTTASPRTGWAVSEFLQNHYFA